MDSKKGTTAPDAAAAASENKPLKKIDPIDNPETFADYIPVNPEEALFPAPGQPDTAKHRALRQRVAADFAAMVAHQAHASELWACASGESHPPAEGAAWATARRDALVSMLTHAATHTVLRHVRDAGERRALATHIRTVIDAAHAAGVWGTWTRAESVNTGSCPVFCVAAASMRPGAGGAGGGSSGSSGAASMRTRDAARARERVMTHLTAVHALVMGVLRLRFAVLVDSSEAFRFAPALTALGMRHIPRPSLATERTYDTFAAAYDKLALERDPTDDSAPTVTLVWLAMYRVVNGRGETVPQDILFAGPVETPAATAAATATAPAAGAATDAPSTAADASAAATAATTTTSSGSGSSSDAATTADDSAAHTLAIEVLLKRPFVVARDGNAATAGGTHVEIALPHAAVRHGETITDTLRRLVRTDLPGADGECAELVKLRALVQNDAKQEAQENAPEAAAAAKRAHEADEETANAARTMAHVIATVEDAARNGRTSPLPPRTEADAAEERALMDAGHKAAQRIKTRATVAEARRKRRERLAELEKDGGLQPGFQFVHVIASHGAPLPGTLGINLAYELSVPDADRTRLFKAAHADTSGATLVYRVPLEAPYRPPQEFTLTPAQLFDPRRVGTEPHIQDAYRASLEAHGNRNLSSVTAHTLGMIIAEIGRALNVRDARIAQLRRLAREKATATATAADPGTAAAATSAADAATRHDDPTRLYWYWMEVSRSLGGGSSGGGAAGAAKYEVSIWLSIERPDDAHNPANLCCLPPEVIIAGGAPVPSLERAQAFWNSTRNTANGDWLFETEPSVLHIHRPKPIDGREGDYGGDAWAIAVAQMSVAQIMDVMCPAVKAASTVLQQPQPQPQQITPAVATTAAAAACSPDDCKHPTLAAEATHQD